MRSTENNEPQETKNFSGADLSEAAMSFDNLVSHAINLEKVDAFGVSFTSSDFTNGKLNNGLFDSSNFTGTKLVNASMKGSTFINAVLEKTDLTNAIATNTFFILANLKNANLTNAKLSNSTFKEANLKNANLKGAELKFTNFIGADLSNIEVDDNTKFYMTRFFEVTGDLEKHEYGDDIYHMIYTWVEAFKENLNNIYKMIPKHTLLRDAIIEDALNTLNKLPSTQDKNKIELLNYLKTHALITQINSETKQTDFGLFGTTAHNNDVNIKKIDDLILKINAKHSSVSRSTKT